MSEASLKSHSVKHAHGVNVKPDSHQKPQKKKKKRKLPPTAFLRDGKRRIDFVLAFHKNEYNIEDKRYGHEEDHIWARSAFERALKRRGLELEQESYSDAGDKKTVYVKLHAPFEALAIQAELEQLQMPTMRSDMEPPKPSLITRSINKLRITNPFDLQPHFRFGKDTTEYFTDAFTRARQDEFLIEDKDVFFTDAQRIYLVWGIISSTRIVFNWVKDRRFKKISKGLQCAWILKNKISGNTKPLFKTKEKPQNSSEDSSEGRDSGDIANADPDTISNISGESFKAVKFVDIKYLITQKVYTAAFPLHDGELVHDNCTTHQHDSAERWPMRKYLYESWARPGQWYRYQPLDAIRRYFGEKVGLYFAWLGFYTKMLILPSFVGLIFFFSSIISFEAEDGQFVHEDIQDFCDLNRTISRRTLCRNCRSTTCDYSTLNDLCSYAKLTRYFDNSAASAFAIFMAIWAVCFLEMWKRRQMELSVRWDVTEQKTEGQIRPDFILKAPTTRANPVTKMQEPYLPRTSRMQRITASVATVVFFMAVVTGLIATVMAYKILGPIFWRERLKVSDNKGGFKTRFDPTLVTSITASIINGFFIGIMSKIYSKVAWRLTLMEYPRTDKDFEESYTYKVFMFQSVNYYGTLVYLAFIRGQLLPPPQLQSNFQQRCNATGCMLDVSIQLGIIMTGKQAINNFLELGLPLIKNWYRNRIRSFRKYRTKSTNKVWKCCFKAYAFICACLGVEKGQSRQDSVENIVDVTRPRWERDHALNAQTSIPLFSDYLEMLIQYGFVTMFVPAFPLTPLFALLNNIIEIRLDAYKNVTQVRRPVPIRVKTIAPWDRLLTILTKVAVLSNAALIAITTDFIDRQVYYNWYRDSDMVPHAESYMDFVLTKFDTSLYCRGDAQKNLEEDAGNKILDALGSSSTMDSCANVKGNVTECYFRDYRDPSRDYERSQVWWHVIVAKFSFVLVFEHFVFVLQAILRYLISGVPENVKIRIERSRFLQRQSFLRQNFGEDEFDAISDDEKSNWSSDVTSFVESIVDETDETLETARIVLNEILDDIEDEEYFKRLGVSKDNLSAIPGSIYVEMLDVDLEMNDATTKYEDKEKFNAAKEASIVAQKRETRREYDIDAYEDANNSSYVDSIIEE